MTPLPPQPPAPARPPLRAVGLLGTNPAVVSVVLAAALLAVGWLTTGNASSFSITVLSGLFQGMLLFLVAAGLSIIFGLMDVLNFAQGTLFMAGAYSAYALHHDARMVAALPNGDARFALAVLVATLTGALVGFVLERVLLRPLYARPVFQIVLTFGVSIVLTELIKAVWSTTPYSWTLLFSAREATFRVFGQPFSLYRLFVIGVGLVLVVAVALLLARTRIGIIIRAGVEDATMVEALGTNVRAVFTLVFTLGCALAALGGAVAAPFLGANIGLGNSFLLSAIAVVALGGLGSYVGTAVGSVLVGLAVAVVARIVSAPAINQPVWASITPMLLLVAVLLLRPRGLFGGGHSS